MRSNSRHFDFKVRGANMMTWNLSCPGENEIIRLELHGELTADSVLLLVQDVIRAIEEFSSTVFLVDFRRSVPQMNSFEMYDLTHRLSELGLSRSVKFADIVPKAFWGDFRFMETLCHNCGYCMSIFIDEESARGWLLSTNGNGSS